MLVYPRSNAFGETFPSWGSDYEGDVSFAICEPVNSQPPNAGSGTMIALRAASEAEVISFHAAALAQGGTCEGPPGTRDYYERSFFVAYERDPDGKKLACVFLKHKPGVV
jgi:hypothetical protein